MIVTQRVRSSYENVRPYVIKVSQRVEDVLRPYCEREHFLFEGRLKELESLAEKLESGGCKSWTDIGDLYACTVVILDVAQEGEVCDFLRQSFEEVRWKRRGQMSKDPESFVFDETRFVGRIRVPPSVVDVPELPSIYSVCFEVQIQSLFAFAWTKTTHGLSYKAPSVDWKRYRLSAHLKAGTEQLEALVAGFDDAVALLGEGSSPSIADKARICEFFSELSREGHLPSEVVPKDWSRFADNIYRFLQVAAGLHTARASDAPLTGLEPSLRRFREYAVSIGPKRFPRSLSLFQSFIGVELAAHPIEELPAEYCLPIEDQLEEIFGVKWPDRNRVTNI